MLVEERVIKKLQARLEALEGTLLNEQRFNAALQARRHLDEVRGRSFTDNEDELMAALTKGLSPQDLEQIRNLGEELAEIQEQTELLRAQAERMKDAAVSAEEEEVAAVASALLPASVGRRFASPPRSPLAGVLEEEAPAAALVATAVEAAGSTTTRNQAEEDVAKKVADEEMEGLRASLQRAEAERDQARWNLVRARERWEADEARTRRQCSSARKTSAWFEKKLAKSLARGGGGEG